MDLNGWKQKNLKNRDLRCNYTVPCLTILVSPLRLVIWKEGVSKSARITMQQQVYNLIVSL